MNSLIPSAFVEVGSVEFKFMIDKAGATPATAFPNTSVTFAVYFTIVDELAVAIGAKAKL